MTYKQNNAVMNLGSANSQSLKQPKVALSEVPL